MSIFNSLGSNYDFNFVLNSLLSFNDPSDLEKLLEEKYGKRPILVYKGRQALELALKSLNLDKDSFVAINGFTCFALYQAIKKANLNVKYLDINKGELNFSATTLKEALKNNKKIKAVIIQNTLGYPCEIENISKICQENNLILIEDLAHSIGTKYESGEETGRVGDFVILSFSQDKMVDGICGGALITKTPVLNLHPKGVGTKQQLIDRFYPFFTWVIRKTYFIGIGKLFHFILKRFNLLSQPMTASTDIHQLPGWYAKLLTSQFNDLEENLKHRRKIATVYSNNINPKILSKTITDQISSSANLRFPIFVKNRNSLIKFLAENQIFISDIWYDAPIAPKKYLDQTDYKSGLCPNAELASDEILNLPTHKNVKEKDAKRISNLINLWLKSN